MSLSDGTGGQNSTPQYATVYTTPASGAEEGPDERETLTAGETVEDTFLSQRVEDGLEVMADLLKP